MESFIGPLVLDKSDPVPGMENFQKRVRVIQEHAARAEAAGNSAEAGFPKTPQGRGMLNVLMEKPKYRAQQAAFARVTGYIENPASRREVLDWYAIYENRSSSGCGPAAPDVPNGSRLFSSDGTSVDPMEVISQNLRALKGAKKLI
jgi:hypothetical protein